MSAARRSFAMRAGIIVGWALACFCFTVSAHAGETPTQFILAQAKVGAAPHPSASPIPSPHFAGRRGSSFSREAGEGGQRNRPDEGQSDLTGSSALPDWVREAFRWDGSGNMTGKPGAWCAWAVSFWLERTGHRPLPNGMAASALRYGPRLASPRVGAIAVLRNLHHVGLVAAVHGDSVEMISGNWGHRVARAVLPRWLFAAFIGV